MSIKKIRSGFVGLIGQPNAGKSTLLNFLVSEKVSIVSPKPQTTRRRILGIWNGTVNFPVQIPTDLPIQVEIAKVASDETASVAAVEATIEGTIEATADAKTESTTESTTEATVEASLEAATVALAEAATVASTSEFESAQAQMVFIDSPGLIKAAKGLNSFLEKEAIDVIESSDVLVAVLSLDQHSFEDNEEVVTLAKQSRKPWLAIITKTDLNAKAHRIDILKKMIQDSGGEIFEMGGLNEAEGSETKQITASKSEWHQKLMNRLAGCLPESPAPLYDVELFTPETIRNLASEIVREKCFENLHQEIPYSSAVRIIKFDEDLDVPRIHIEILVSKESHKAIVIGKEGSVLKKIGTSARKEIEKLMGGKIFLGLQVNVKLDWYENPRLLNELGYVVEN